MKNSAPRESPSPNLDFTESRIEVASSLIHKKLTKPNQTNSIYTTKLERANQLNFRRKALTDSLIKQ